MLKPHLWGACFKPRLPEGNEGICVSPVQDTTLREKCQAIFCHSQCVRIGENLMKASSDDADDEADDA